MKMLLLFAATLVMQVSHAQVKEDKFYLFDKNMQPAGIKTATSLLVVSQPAPRHCVRTYYNVFGPRISRESFTDESGKIRNGMCLYYHSNGGIDSIGEYLDNVLNGSWYFYDETGRVTRQKDYDKGIVTKDTLFEQRRNDASVTAAVPGEVESVFPGGQQGWTKFIIKNFNYPKRALDAKVMGTVRLQFIVDPKGNVTASEVNKSVEYSLDEEALRIINKSPRWIPASKDGVALASYKIQPVTFQFTR